MANHPNRGPKGPASNPKPEDIIASREAAGLTQTEAATLIFSKLRTWQHWESGEIRMHPALWELFRIKLDNKKQARPKLSTLQAKSDKLMIK